LTEKIFFAQFLIVATAMALAEGFVLMLCLNLTQQ